MRILAFLASAVFFFTSTAWGAAHWVDVTTTATSGADGTGNYMRWSPLVADVTGNVTKLRISIREFGSPTPIRLALYNQSGVKQTEGTATVTATGYTEIVVPAVKVSQGSSYHLAVQAASGNLGKFNCGAASGGLEGANAYTAGMPLRLPAGWGAPLLTGGMYIEAGPVADFSGTPTLGSAPMAVQFTDKSSGSIAGWLWNFGDSAQSTEQNPQHTYTVPGLYQVSLTVSGPDGADTAVKADYVQVAQEIPPGNNEYSIKIDSAAHQKFGLYYPATYRFRIPPGSSGLSAQYRYLESTWNTLPVKTAGDLFNGIDAVRFDYSQGFAYVSIRFSRTSDNIYLRILDSSSQPVDIQFDRIPKYYDNRKAAVTVTLDDWDLDADAGFRLAVDQLNSLGLYYSVGLRLLDPPWSSIQEKINQSGDKLEISSHTIYHSCDANTYKLHGYDTEVTGCRDLIRENLTFPANPYIPLFIDPCGYWDSSLYAAVTAAGHLIERSVDEGSDFIPWDASAGRYGRAGVSYDWWGTDSQSQLTSANSIFNSTIAAGGIYHLMDHPWQKGHFATGSYEMQHLNYVKGRADIWYAPFGPMYQYHYLQEMRGNLTVQAVSGTPAAPTANFSATPLTGMAPLSVSFTDSSTGTITGWSWDFGDATTSTQQNPVHVYSDAGTYSVKLVVTGSAGSNSITKSGYIQVGAPTPPVANFSAMPVTGTAPLSVTFTDSSTGTITSWSWDFGDATTSTQQNPVHVYNNAGTYTVKLTVTGPAGSNTVTKTGYIQAGTPTAPMANFSAMPLTGTAPLAVNFTDSSTGTITGWSWDFGDTTTSAQQNPVHVYNNAGTYTVNLTVTGPAGSNSMTRTGYVQVQPAPAGHWVDVTTSKSGTGMYGTANYMSWGPVVADASGSVTRLRISIKDFGSSTQIRLALYSQGGAKLTEGVATVTAAGYIELAVPAVPVTQGTRYFLAAQAASPNLYRFDSGPTTGGLEGPNRYAAGLPATLPGSWKNRLLTSGMYIQ